MAKRYKLSDKTLGFAGMCNHNALVAESLGQEQLAHTWRMLHLILEDSKNIRYFDSDDEEFMAMIREAEKEAAKKNKNKNHKPVANGQSGAKNGEPEARQLAAAEATNGNDNSAQRSRHASSKQGRSRTGTIDKQQQQASNVRRRSSQGARGKSASGGSRTNTQQKHHLHSDEEYDEQEAAAEEDVDGYERTLTNIASGQSFGVSHGHDFFGANEISSHLVLDPLVAPPEAYNVNPNLNELPKGWVLQEEAFQPQVDLDALFNQDDEQNDENVDQLFGGAPGAVGGDGVSDFAVVNGGGAAGPVNGYGGPQAQQDANAGSSLQTVTIEDQTSALVCIPSATECPDWDGFPTAIESIKFYAENVDVQVR